MNIQEIMKKWEKLIDFCFHYIGIVFFAVCWFIYKFFYPFWKNLQPTISKIFDWTSGKKTYIVSIAGIISLLIAYKAGTCDLANVVTNLPMLVLAITFRHGMARHSISKIEGGDDRDNDFER
jgi:hypothetical protein